MTTIDKFDKVTADSTQILWDSAALAQKQNAQLVQQWLETVEASQAASRDLATRLLAQAQNAQNLWLEFVQESYRTNMDVLSKLAQGQIKEAGERVESFARQANGAAKKTEAATAGK
jgi:polyhydroxyalkanoate synthesis regulator phasin